MHQDQFKLAEQLILLVTISNLFTLKITQKCQRASFVHYEKTRLYLSKKHHEANLPGLLVQQKLWLSSPLISFRILDSPNVPEVLEFLNFEFTE